VVRTVPSTARLKAKNLTVPLIYKSNPETEMTRSVSKWIRNGALALREGRRLTGTRLSVYPLVSLVPLAPLAPLAVGLARLKV
jgi:hypothetical protein